jgi:hypothetical protein
LISKLNNNILFMRASLYLIEEESYLPSRPCPLSPELLLVEGGFSIKHPLWFGHLGHENHPEPLRKL